MAQKPYIELASTTFVTSFPMPCPFSTASLLFLKHKCIFLLPGLCICYSLCLTCSWPSCLCDPSLHLLQFSAQGHLIQKASSAQSISNRTSFTSWPPHLSSVLLTTLITLWYNYIHTCLLSLPFTEKGSWGQGPGLTCSLQYAGTVNAHSTQQTMNIYWINA